MNRVRMIATSLVLAAVLTTGCFHSVKHLDRLHAGMTREQVVEAVGKPYRKAGAVKTKYGQTVDVLEYLFKVRYNEEYWLYFVGDTLVMYGEASDWGTVAHNLYETDFKAGGAE